MAAPLSSMQAIALRGAPLSVIGGIEGSLARHTAGLAEERTSGRPWDRGEGKSLCPIGVR